MAFAVVVAIAGVAFGAGVLLANGSQDDPQPTATTSGPATTSAVPATTTSAVPVVTTLDTTTTIPPTTSTTLSPPIAPPEPQLDPALQAWSDEFARRAAALDQRADSASDDEICAVLLGTVEEWAGALANPPSPGLTVAYDRLLQEERYTYGVCFGLGMDGLQTQTQRLRDMRSAVIAEIVAAGADYLEV